MRFLLVTSFAFFLLRLPSLVEPYWYGDEGIYQTIGIALNQGRELYSGIWDNKPPLLYILYAMFNGDQYTARFVSLIFGLLSVISFFFLSKKLLQNEKNSAIATICFALLFALPWLEGNIANAENFMLLPIIVAGYLMLQQPNAKYYILNTKYRILFGAGLLLGLAFLLKIIALFDTAAFTLFLLFCFTKPLHFDKGKNLKHLLKPITKDALTLLAGFATPVLISLLYFTHQGSLIDYLQASFFQNIGYVGYKNQFLIPQGFLILKLLLLSGAVAYLFLKRKNIPEYEAFVLLWFMFSLFNSLFSQRSYIHYLLVLLPSFSLMLGLALNSYKKSLLVPIVFLLGIICVISVFNLGGIKKTPAYYNNFLMFTLNQKSVYDYQRFFDSDVPRDYELANFLKTRPDKNQGVFIWGNSAQIYALSGTLPPGRYTVTYHIIYQSKNAIAEMTEVLKVKNPKYIIIMPDLATYPFSLQNYAPIIMLKDSTIYERNN